MDSDDEAIETSKWRGVPGTVILINVFDTSKDTESVAHVATCRMVRQYLRSSGSQNLSVCLYGTEDLQTSAFGTKSVVEVFPLAPPTLDNFKKLRGIELSTYKPAQQFVLSDALWHCSKMFTNCKTQLSSKNVILLTRLDIAPVVTDQKPTLKRVVDLVDANIDIRIINVADSEYKVDSFYEKFLIEANKGNNFVLPKPISDPKEIERVMHQQSHRHLAVARLNFDIGNEISIGVGVYNLLIRSSQYPQKKVNLDRDSNAIVASVTKTMKVSAETSSTSSAPMDVDDEPSQVPLLKSEILYYQEYGGERVEFTDYEMKKLKNPFGPPMMKLLGFKPAGILRKEKWFLKSGYFLFPNEGVIEGSTIAFKALHQACVETGVIGICVLCTRVNAKPIIVALSPCSHPLGLEVEIGFDVIQIPFVENVRDISVVDGTDEDSNVTQDQHKFMKDMLKSLQFDYKPDMFENPKVQSEHRVVEAIALEEEDLDLFVDTTKQVADKFEVIREDLFEELFGPFGEVAPKRSTTSKEKGPARKTPKGDEYDEAELQDRIKYEAVDKYTVKQLKNILLYKDNSNIPSLTNLKKKELVDLVYKYCS